MELEIINKLFLELSQITTAKTGRELIYEKALKDILNKPDGTPAIEFWKMAEDTLYRAEANEG